MTRGYFVSPKSLVHLHCCHAPSKLHCSHLTCDVVSANNISCKTRSMELLQSAMSVMQICSGGMRAINRHKISIPSDDQ